MSEVKILNVDALVKVTRAVTIKGQDYQVADVTVDAWLQSVERSRQLKDVTDTNEHIKALRDIVASRLPECPKDVIGGLTFTQLTAINSFINAPETADEVAGEGDAGKDAAAAAN